jgi:nicotinamide-nucleotide amidase
VRAARTIAPGLIRRANEIVRLLKRRRLTIVTAESCTGGLIAAAFSQADGASAVLQGAFVTYTKAQKNNSLGIRRATLAHRGSVTPQIARLMAEGALKRSPAKIALSVTGVLGPAPDEDGNPVGLVHVCCMRRTHAPRLREACLGHRSHDRLRSTVVTMAFDLIETTVRGT